MVVDITKKLEPITFEFGCYQCSMDFDGNHRDIHTTSLCVPHLIKRLRIAEGTEQQVQADNLPEDGDSDYYDDTKGW